MSVKGKLTLRNYRCFDWNNPAVLEFGGGFTAFVGSNNSGKSTVLRSIYELRDMFYQAFSSLNSSNKFQTGTQPLGVSDITEIANESDPEKFQFTIEVYDSLIPQNDERFYHAVEILFEYHTQTRLLFPKKVKAINAHRDEWNLDDGAIRSATSGHNLPNLGYSDNAKMVNYSDLMAFTMELYQSRYFPAFRNAINEGAGNYYDLPVGTALVATWDQWKAGNLRTQQIAISKVENEIAGLLGFSSLQINANQNKTTLNLNIDGRPQKLHEVGAGVAQLIIVLAAALVNKPPYILIDEPELSLHPALQLNFLATLGSYAQKGLLYSTHSISLARSTAQRIYAVKRIKNGLSQMHPFNDNKINYGGWLGELSYSSRIELGCEGLLLVEGSTDVMFFQEFLRKLGKDQKYVVMQLGGSSMIKGGVVPQLSELTRIIDDPSKIRVFIDSEKDSNNSQLAEDRKQFVKDCESVGIKVQVSRRRATENYFEENGIKKVLGADYKPLGEFQKLKSSPKPWHKSENWRIARETAIEDIKDTDLGKFLDSL